MGYRAGMVVDWSTVNATRARDAGLLNLDALNGRLPPWHLQRPPAPGDWSMVKGETIEARHGSRGWYRPLQFIGARLTSDKSHRRPIGYEAPRSAAAPSNHE